MKRALFSVLVVALAAGISPVFSQADPLDFDHQADQLLVKFRPGTEASLIAAINGQLGGSTQQRFRLAPDLHLVQLPSGTNLRSAMDYYRLQSEVVYAEPNHIYRLTLVPNDTRFGELWGMNNTGQSGGLVDFDIDAPEAWDTHTDASNVVIGSIDTGLDQNHEDLSANVWNNADEIPGNGTDDDNNGFIDDTYGWNFVANNNSPNDDNSHGSHTCGTMAAVGNNGKGVAGVTWGAQLISIKVCNSFGSCPTNAIISGIDYATDNGANVTNNSYGGGGFNQSMKDAIDRADAAGSIFVAAAGNNGRNTDSSPFYPASYTSPNIISVANMTRFGGRSGSSNFGLTSVDLGAPGSTILSTNPNNAYGNKSGTSMASPHVAGAVAYLMGFNPTLGHLEYKQIIMDGVAANDAMNGNSVTGGVLNIKNSLDMMPPINIPPENDPPVADAGGPYKGRAFRAITFDGSGSSDPDEVELGDFISTYVWDFGDGTITTTTSPTVTHTYGPGNNDYVVTLTVKDKFRVSSAPATSTCRIRGGGRKPKP